MPDCFTRAQDENDRGGNWYNMGPLTFSNTKTLSSSYVSIKQVRGHIIINILKD